MAPIELDLRGGVGAVAELVLQPLKPHAVAGCRRGRKRGTRKQDSPSRRLRQHQEGVRHRRRHEPFVAGEAIEAVAGALGPGRVGATSVPPCFSVMPMPRVTPAFSTGGCATGRICARGSCGAQSSASFGRASSAASEALVMVIGQRWPHSSLRRQIEAGGARLVRACRPPRRPCPRSRNAGRRRRAAHQRVIGRVELDHVDAPALGGRAFAASAYRLVGEARQFQASGVPDVAPSAVEILPHRLREALDERAEQAGRCVEEVDAGSGGGWLVTSWVTQSCPRRNVARFRPRAGLTHRFDRWREPLPRRIQRSRSDALAAPLGRLCL